MILMQTILYNIVQSIDIIIDHREWQVDGKNDNGEDVYVCSNADLCSAAVIAVLLNIM